MRVTIHLTHHRGIRLNYHQSHNPNNHIAEPIIELFDVALYLIGPQGLHLRGLERLAVDGRSQFVVQGWVVEVR
jgi:hypothetical protein